MTSPRIRTMSTRTTAGPIGATGSERALWRHRSGSSGRSGSPAASVRKLGLRNSNEWAKYCRGELPGHGAKPGDIPSDPSKTYKNGRWTSWGDWLGTGEVANLLRRYRPFKQARSFVRRLGLRNKKEDWVQYCKGELAGYKHKPEDIPANPAGVYKNEGWIGWGDWLGTHVVATHVRRYLRFANARDFVRRLGLRNREEWTRYCTDGTRGCCKKPDNIPASPAHVYRDDGWSGWGDWLGTGRVATRLRRYLPFAKAREFVRRLGLRNREEWARYCKDMARGCAKKPDNVPAGPARVYGNSGWRGWADWLGKGPP